MMMHKVTIALAGILATGSAQCVIESSTNPIKDRVEAPEWNFELKNRSSDDIYIQVFNAQRALIPVIADDYYRVVGKKLFAKESEIPFVRTDAVVDASPVLVGIFKEENDTYVFNKGYFIFPSSQDKTIFFLEWDGKKLVPQSGRKTLRDGSVRNITAREIQEMDLEDSYTMTRNNFMRRKK